MKMMKTFFGIVLVAMFFCIGGSAKAVVLDLGDADFKETIADTSKVFFVKFFAPWCGHCKRLAPTWEELAEADLFPEVQIVRVDCTSAKETCNQQEIRGYPTLKVFAKGVELKKYDGARDLGAMRTFIQTIASETVHETSE